MADKERSDIEFTKENKSDANKKIEADNLPVYMDQITLSDKEKKRLVDEAFAEIEIIKQERTDDKLEEKWDAWDNQYDGKVSDSRLQFNLCRRTTKVKVDSIVRKIKQAFFNCNPRYSVSPRPEFAKEGGQDICDKQQDFIDYRLDNTPTFEPEVGRTIWSATHKGAGVLKVWHEIRRVWRKRDERYSGQSVIIGVDANTDTPISENKGLKEFLANWPDAATRYPGLVKRLEEGKDIEFTAKFKETVYNDVKLRCVNLKDFFVRKDVEGYDGLKTTNFYAERVSYSYSELKQYERDGKFENIDELTYGPGKDNQKGDQYADYKHRNYNVFECIYMFIMDKKDDEEDDGEPIKINFWVGEDTKVFLGATYYPYYLIDCNYIPFYIDDKKPGFYKYGISELLTDANVAENAILNLMLSAGYIENMITPIVPEGHPAEAQFLEKRWTVGVPITVEKQGDIDFLQNHIKRTNVDGLIKMVQYIVQGEDDATGVSSLMSGRESPIDPTAPAAKTMALLQQSGDNISEYLMTMSPAFNELGYAILHIYYQIATEGRKYKLPASRVVGSDPFGNISRAELAARTNIQVQAHAFDIDKLNAKREDVALYSLLRQEPLITRNPVAVWIFLKAIIKNWGPKWANIVDQILPTIDQFKQEQSVIALKAVALYVKSVLENSKMTGVAPEFNVNELLPLMSDLMSQAATNPPEEVMKEREKQGKDNVQA